MMADSTSLDVLGFLERKLNLTKEIIDKFQKEKIDKDALSKMNEKELEELGVEAKGDRIKLLAFARRSDPDREEKMKKLKEIVEQGKSSRGAAKKPKASVKKYVKPTLKFEFRWKHFQEGKGYTPQRLKVGGGTRDKDIPRHSTPYDWLKQAEELFFPERRNLQGKLEDMNTSIADFKDKEFDLWDSITAEEYKENNGLHTNRLVLLTKLKIMHVSDEDEDDDDLCKPTWGSDDEVSSQCEVKQINISDDNDYDCDDQEYLITGEQEPTPGHESQNGNSKVVNRNGLIGTSVERMVLFDSIQKEYQESLEVDRAKQRERDMERMDNTRKEELRETRKRRLPLEPGKDQPHVIISVRHVGLGVVSRRFPKDCKVMGIYDWVGSLAASPEHFSLTQVSPNSIIYPDEDAKPLSMSMLHMQTRDEPMPLAKDDEEVEFYSGRQESDHDETLPLDQNENGLRVLDSITEKPPTQLLEEDKVLSSEGEATRDFLESLQWKRRIEADKLEEHGFAEVSRHNCVKDLLNLYKTGDITKSRPILSFKQEDAVGDGVCREVYSVFWDSFVSTCCEGVSQFALTVSPSISLDDFFHLGRLYTHQFILTGTIPLQITEATIQHAVTGEVTEECLLESFKMLLHEKEREIINQALLGKQPFSELAPYVIDILSEYGVGNIPNQHNIREMLLRVSMTELISKPYVCILKFKEGMGSFWKDITAEEINALYKSCTPTASNVVNALYLERSTPQAEKILRWLTRYLQNQEHRVLTRFLRFCTGTDLADRRILVRLEAMSELAKRPKSQTCFGILTLPSNYRSYAQFFDSFDFYMHNPQMWEFNDI